jgi:hypothetical protein
MEWQNGANFWDPQTLNKHVKMHQAVYELGLAKTNQSMQLMARIHVYLLKGYVHYSCGCERWFYRTILNEVLKGIFKLKGDEVTARRVVKIL